MKFAENTHDPTSEAHTQQLAGNNQPPFAVIT